MGPVNRFNDMHPGEIQILEGLRGPQPSYSDEEKTTFMARPTPMGPRARQALDAREREMAASSRRSSVPPKAPAAPRVSSSRASSAPPPAPWSSGHVEEIREHTAVGSYASQAAPLAIAMPMAHVPIRNFDSREFKLRELEARERELEVREIEARAIESRRLETRKRDLERRERDLMRREVEVERDRDATPMTFARVPPSERPALPPPLPRREPPRLDADRADTMRPVAMPIETAHEVLRASAAPMTTSFAPPAPPPRRSPLVMAASVGMIASIFALGITLGAVAFGKAHAHAEAAAAAAQPVEVPTIARASIAAAAPKLDDAKPAAPEAPKVDAMAKTDATKTDATAKSDAKPGDAAKADATNAKGADAKLADAHPWGDAAKHDDKSAKADDAKPKSETKRKKHASHAAAVAAAAPADKADGDDAPVAAAPKKPPAAKTGDDLDAANEADALAKAQLEASLR